MTAKTHLATVDTRPIFEQALSHGRALGLIDDERLAGIRREGAKGIVQLAKFFSSEHLRPALEDARIRLVTLVSLALELDSGSNLSLAVDLLRQKTLLSLSKAGATALRSLLKLPDSSVLQLDLPVVESEKQMLNPWTLTEPMTLAHFQAEKLKREGLQIHHELAYWLAKRLGVSREDLQRAAEDSDSVINSAMLLLFVEKSPRAFFSPNQFMKLHAAAIKKRKPGFPAVTEWLTSAPIALQPALIRSSQYFIGEVLPTLKSAPASAFVHGGNDDTLSCLFYFEAEGLEDHAHHDQKTKSVWRKLTRDKGGDPDVVNTLLLTVAAGMEVRSVLRKKDALQIMEHYKVNGFSDERVFEFIQRFAPFHIQDALKEHWQEDFGQETRNQLDYGSTTEGLAYLRKYCAVSFKSSAK